MGRPRRRLADVNSGWDGKNADRSDAVWKDMMRHPEAWLEQARAAQRTAARRHFYYVDNGPLGGLTRLAMREKGQGLVEVHSETGIKAPNQTSSIDVFDQGCRESIWFWISGGLSSAPPEYPYREFLKPCVLTVDEHEEEGNEIVKPFPWQKQYVRSFVDLMLEHPLVVVEKSRKVMATWIAVIRFLWMAQFWPGREIVFQCKKEEESKARLLDRAWFVYQHQPAWFRQYHPAIRKETTIEFFELERDEMGRFSNRSLQGGRAFKPKPTGSRILAVAEGDEPWRGPTVSGGLVDEAAHFRAFDEVLTAAQASVEGTKNIRPLVVLSTPSGKGRFWRLAHDLEGASLVAQEKPVVGSVKAHEGCVWQGMSWRKNSNGWLAIFLHHSADAEKDPDCGPEGRAYRDRLEEHYKGDPLGLAREYDLSSEVGAGLPVYGLAFNAALNVSSTVQYQRGKTVYRGWDFGYRRPFTCWAFEDDENTIVTLYEILGQDILIHEFADQVLQLSEKWFGWTENGQLVLPKFRDFCDPSGVAKSDKSKRSSVEVLNSKGIYPGFLRRGIDEGLVTVRQLLRPREKIGTPELIFHERCSILIEAMKGGYHYPEENPTHPEVQSDVPEKDGYFDHGCDALRYLVNGVRTPSGKKKVRDGNGQKPKRKLSWGKKTEEDEP